MAKIVYNACYGGFGMSEAAVLRYFEIKGQPVYPEGDSSIFKTYWLVPPDQRDGILSRDERRHADQDARTASSARHRELTFYPASVSRTDPILIQVVEELGEAANGVFSRLLISEMPSGTAYRIDEYDGLEIVMTNDDYDWAIAP